MIRTALAGLSLILLAAAAHAAETPPLHASKVPQDFSQQKRALTPAETRGVARLNEASLRILQRYVPDLQEAAITPQTLDRAYDAWLHDTRADKPDADAVIPAFGVRLGTLTLKSCKGGWLHVKDNYGEAIAIEFEQSGHQIYPLDSVNKRYSQGENHFFADLHKVYLLACTNKLK